MPALPPAIDIREVGLRDGLQLEDHVPLATKVEILQALVATGVGRIEATSFVSPRAVPAFADAESLARELHRWPQVHFSALVAGLGGARRAIDAGVHNVEYVVSAADGHSMANVGRTTAESVALVEDVAALTRDAGGMCEVIIAVAWDCPFDGPTPPEQVVGVARRAVELGADQICLGDTVGTAVPGRVVELISSVRAACSDVPLGMHFHDTRGAGLANVVAAAQEGVTQFDASVGGLGGCPFAPGASGNIATEELVYLLEGSGVSTGLDIERLLQAADLVRGAVGHELSSNLYRAGGPPTPRGR